MMGLSLLEFEKMLNRDRCSAARFDRRVLFRQLDGIRDARGYRRGGAPEGRRAHATGGGDRRAAGEVQLVIQLYFVEELNLAEIAEILEVSVPRVHQLERRRRSEKLRLSLVD